VLARARSARDQSGAANDEDSSCVNPGQLEQVQHAKSMRIEWRGLSKEASETSSLGAGATCVVIPTGTTIGPGNIGIVSLSRPGW
jgi:hypothetical protein